MGPSRPTDSTAGSGREVRPALPAWLRLAVNTGAVVIAMTCVAVFARAMTRFHAGIELDQLLIFYVAPIAVGALFVWALRLPFDVRANLVVLAVTIGTTALAAEFVLLANSREQRGLPAVPRPNGSVMPSAYDVVMERRAAGTHAFPRVPGGFLDRGGIHFTDEAGALYPLGPAPGNSTVLLCDEGRPAVWYEGDRFGFNNADSLWDAPSEVFLIGDSYTHGVCVEASDQVGSRLRSQWRTINLGASGAGPLRELGILREYAANKTPPVVVWIYFEGNDLIDLAEEETRPWLLSYLDASHRQDLASRRESLDRSYAEWLDSVIAAGPGPLTAATGQQSFVQLLSRAPRLQLVRALLRVGTAFPNERPRLGRLPEVIRRANADVEAWGGQLVFVYLPSFSRYQFWIGGGPKGHDEVSTLVRDTGITFVDLDSVFRTTRDPRQLWAHPRGHLSAEGYRVTAEAISAAVEALGSLPSLP